MNKNLKMKLLGVALATSLTGVANAGIVTTWSYDNQAGFLDDYVSTTDFGVGGVAASGSSDAGSSNGNILDTNGDTVVDGFDAVLATHLAWGVPSTHPVTNPDGLQSSLSIDSAAVGSVTTNGGYIQGTDITHNNWAQKFASDQLVSANVLDGLTLVPTSPDLGPDLNYAPQLAFGIAFFESPNSADPCADGNPNNVGDNINGCGDTFEITGLTDLGIVPVIDALNGTVEFTVPFQLDTGDAEYDDVLYFITTRLSGLTILPDTYVCQSGSDCFGFVTKESEANVLKTEFKITTRIPRAVPEPATIALFGLGLLATGFARRRKNS